MPLTVGPRLIAVAKLALSLACLAWCLNQVQLGQLTPLLADARIAVLLGLAPLVALEAAAGAWRFKLILDTVHVLPVRTHLAQYLVASYFNILLPSSMGGDAVRVVMLKRTGASITNATLTILVDRILGVFSLVIIALVAIMVADIPAPLEKLVLAAAAAMAIVGIAAMLGYRWAGSRAGRWPWLDRAVETLHRIRSAPAAVARSAVMSLVFQALTISFTWLIAVGFHLDVPATQVFALVPLTWLATMVPVSIGGLGVREVSFTVLFGQVGVPPAAALTLSLGTYAVFVAMALVGALVVALTPGAHRPVT